MADRDRPSGTLARALGADDPPCRDCGRPVANAADWVRAEANNAAGGDPEAPWSAALCWGRGNNCEAADPRDRIAALEAECDWLRLERDALRLACQMLVTHGADLARLVHRGRDAIGDDADLVLLEWVQCVASARGDIVGAER